MYKIQTLIPAVFLLFLSCTEKEIITVNEHYNETIPGNETPPYAGVTTVEIQNYVNRIYIDLLGREPGSSELESATAQLRENDLSDTSRELLLDLLMGTQEYYDKFFERYSRAYLGGTTEQTILYYLQEIDQIIEILMQENNDPAVQAYLIERDKMQALQAAPAEYKAGTISISEFMGRIVYNLIYDEINMGAENFTISCFENLLKRLPTEVELQSGVTMVEGFSAQLLQREGHSKADLIEVITTTDEFFQGLVIDIYRQLLARDPDSVETGKGLEAFKAGQTVQELQKTVMKDAEYAGF